jgi:hypothetical protein
MSKVDAGDVSPAFSCSTGFESEIVESLRASFSKGEQWPRALLKAVRDWSLAEEEIGGETYRYLLLGEAFDWLVLAKRLLDEVRGIVPVDEEEALIFHGKLPWELSETQFRKSLGEEKYRAHLNYFYGVVVEESLLLAAEEEIRKQQFAQGLPDDDQVIEWAYQRVYGKSLAVLLGTFQRELGRPKVSSLSLTDLKEFTYWLFKHRIESSDSSRVASDTKKGLTRLQRSKS